MSFRLKPDAKSDLEEIGDHIAQDNPAAAKRFIDKLSGRFAILGRNPNIGRARPDIRPDLRSLPFGAYIILFRGIDDGAEIVRVVHGARDLGTLFADGDDA